MSNKLAIIEHRIASVRQLGAVVSAMRGIAAVRSREARQSLAGIRSYATTVTAAIAQALAVLPEGQGVAHRTGEGTHILMLLMSEQGFVGGFNERLTEAIRQSVAALNGAPHEIFVAGERGLGLLAESDLEVEWSTGMISHASEATDLAGRLADRLFERLAEGGVATVQLLFAEPSAAGQNAVVVRRIAPFDYSRFPAATGANRPMMTLPPEALLERLADEFTFAEIAEAIVLSFAAENEARMEAMTKANSNAEDKLAQLQQLFRLSRQEEITSEIIELAGSVLESH